MSQSGRRLPTGCIWLSRSNDGAVRFERLELHLTVTRRLLVPTEEFAPIADEVSAVEEGPGNKSFDRVRPFTRFTFVPLAHTLALLLMRGALHSR
jgi:hypothetical protein